MTRAEINLLRSIRKPCNVWGYGIAVALRELDAAHPGLIRIVDPVGDFDGVDEMPYFGVMLTEQGKAAIKAGSVGGDS